MPEDVTGVPTPLIVKKIRCEARTAVKDNLIAQLNAKTHLSKDEETVLRFLTATIPTKPNAHVLRAIKNLHYLDAAIAYDFTLDITEMNNLDPQLPLLKPMSNAGQFKPTIGGQFDRKRQNQRTFLLADSFDELIINLQDKECSDLADGKNYMYPIAGKIGIDEMVNTFVELAATPKNLIGTTPANAPPGVSGPHISDTLTFTTTLSNTITPNITINPVGNALQVTTGPLGTAMAQRLDIHKVIVTLAECPTYRPNLGFRDSRTRQEFHELNRAHYEYRLRSASLSVAPASSVNKCSKAAATYINYTAFLRFQTNSSIVVPSNISGF